MRRWMLALALPIGLATQVASVGRAQGGPMVASNANEAPLAERTTRVDRTRETRWSSSLWNENRIVLAHAMALHHEAMGISARPGDGSVKEHVAQLRHALERAQRSVDQLREIAQTDPAMMVAIKAIEAREFAARDQLLRIRKEVANPRPDMEKIGAHAASIHQAIKRAEVEQAQLMKARGIAEPGEP